MNSFIKKLFLQASVRLRQGRKTSSSLQQTLMEEDGIFRAIVECFSDHPIMVHDIADGSKVVYANAAACSHFGTDLQTILGARPEDFDPRHTDDRRQELIAHLDRGVTYKFESIHRTTAGELVPVEIFAHPLVHKGARFSICLVNDLRPRIAAKNHLIEMQKLQAEHENARRLTRFAQSAPGFMYTVERHPDGQLVMTYASPAVENLYGLSVEDVLADVGSVFALILPEDRERVMRLINESFAGQTTFHAEYRIQHVTKGLRWMAASSVPDLRPDGKLEWHGFVIDVTERKQLEERAASQEREFRILFENAPDNIIRYDRDAKVIYINPVLEKTLGDGASQIIGKRSIDIQPNNPAVSEYQNLIEQVIKTGQPAEYLMISGQDGLGRALYDNIRIAPAVSPDGEIIGAIAIGRDLTQQKNLELELSKREREFRTLIENSPDMMIRYDLECRRIYINQAFLNATGASAKDILGKRVTEIAWWSTNITAEEFEDCLRRVLATGEPETVQLYGSAPQSGAPRHTMIRVVPEYDEYGEIESLMAVVRDVTDLVEIENKLREREQYQRALLDNFPFFVWLKDLDSRLLAANQQYARMAKVDSPLGLEGKTDFDFFPQDLAQRYVEDDKAVLASGLPKSLVEQYSDEHGQLRWMETYKSPVILNGTTVGTVGFSRDVTEQMQTQIALSNRERDLRTLLDNSPDVIIRYDRECRRTFISKNYETVYGIPLSQALGKKPTESWGKPLQSPHAYEQQLRLVMETGIPADIELDWYDENGAYVCQSLRAVPEFDASKKVLSLLTLSRDVSETRRTAQRLKASEHEYRTLVEHSPVHVIRYDLDCRRIFANNAYFRSTGLKPEDALTKPLSQTWRPFNITSDEYEGWLRQIIGSEEASTNLLQVKEADGRVHSYAMRGVPEYDVEGRLHGVLVIGHDVTELKQAELELRQREQEFRALVENTPDTVARYDHNCRRVYANPSMVQEASITLSELLGKTPEEFPGGSQAVDYQKQIRQVLESGEANHFELHWTTGNGTDVCSHIRLTPEFGYDGQVTHVLAVGRDITEIDVYRKQIHTLAFFDPLTALPNRSLLLDRISQTIADASWHGTQFGLMLLDLDRFKEVNDTLGHGVGDLLLREVADRLLECVRSYDTVARLGGDEFAILLPEVRVGNDLATVARKILAAFEHPFHLTGREFFISASVGIALYPSDSAEIDALFKYADSAMYHAKKQGRNNFQFYSKELTARSSERMQIEAALRRAQKNNELELYYQPQVDVVTGKIIGAEALLRWNYGPQGIVTPDRFIPVAEETGLIVGIGEWALTEACRAAVGWNQHRDRPLRVAVNLSIRQFIQNDLVASVRYILAETQCKPEWLKLEITESLLLEDSSQILAMLTDFNDLGVMISIDDFGTGYSALSYLNRFPVSQIKIDRSFVRDIPQERDKAELVKAMISIAQALNLELVAEGVETHQQATYLQAHGCRVVQGYLFGKPMPHAEFGTRLSVETPEEPTVSL